MNLLEDIYQLALEREGLTKKGVEVNRKIMMIARKADEKKLIEDNEYLPVLLWEASALGQEEGFLLGFQYGARIVASCME